MRVRRLATMVRRSTAVAVALGLSGCQVAAQLPPSTVGRSIVPARSVIVQLFEWRWDDIAQECETWLGPKGYGAVQISPPHEHQVINDTSAHFSWHQRYQPVSYQLLSRSGSHTELATMISRCRQAGVKVYADVVITPMASAITQDIEEHHLERQNIEGSDLEDLDLDTGSEQVQTAIAKAMNELLALGVAGFRIDAAHQLPPEHLNKILRRLRPLNTKFHPSGGRPFIYQDIITKGTPPTDASDYFSNGAVIEFRYGRNLGEQVQHGQLKNLVLFGEAWEFLPSHKAVVFTDNHRTQRSSDRNIVTFHTPADGGASYRLANIFMLAWPYGIPKVMSSYDWPREQGIAAGPPTNDQGETLPADCNDSWVCEHRWFDIANMVEFHNVTQGAVSVNHWWDNGNNQIAFARGQHGFVAINNEDQVLSQTLMTGLPTGIYCNVLSQLNDENNELISPSLDSDSPALRPMIQPTSAHCAQGNMELIKVDTLGNASIEVPAYRALALHVAAKH